MSRSGAAGVDHLGEILRAIAKHLVDMDERALMAIIVT